MMRTSARRAAARAHTRQAIEQSRGEFPAANARTRTSHAGLQVSRTRPAVSRHLWGDRNVLSSRPPFAGRPELPGSHAPTLQTMGRSDQSGFRESMNFFTATECLAKIPGSYFFRNLT